MRYRHIEKGTIYRVYSDRGLYWKAEFKSPSATCFFQDGLIFTGCHFDENAHPDEYYSALKDPLVEEIRLLAALSLCLSADEGLVAYYPLNQTLRVKGHKDLTRPHLSKAQIEELLSDYPCRADPPPKASWGADTPIGNYSFRDEILPTHSQELIFTEIRPDDYILNRGLHAFLKSLMLCNHALFTEEALHSLYIAMEAAFSMVKLILRFGGNQNPTAYDAQAFVEQLFGTDSSETTFFQEYYEDRIIAFHPESRFGVFPYLPSSSCDFFYLLDNIRDLFRELLFYRSTKNLSGLTF